MVVVPVLAVGGAVAERRSHAVGHGDALRERPSCGGGAVPCGVSAVGVQAVALQDDVSLVVLIVAVTLSLAAAAVEEENAASITQKLTDKPTAQSIRDPPADHQETFPFVYAFRLLVPGSDGIALGGGAWRVM